MGKRVAMDSGMSPSLFLLLFLLFSGQRKLVWIHPQNTLTQSLRVCGICLVCLSLTSTSCVFTSCYYSSHKTAMAHLQMVSHNPSFLRCFEILHGLNISKTCPFAQEETCRNSSHVEMMFRTSTRP